MATCHHQGVQTPAYLNCNKMTEILTSNILHIIKVKQSHYRSEVAQTVLRKLRFLDFVTTAQNDGKLSALHTGRLYLQEILLLLISV